MTAVANIHVRQPVPYDIIGDSLIVAGVGTSFEGSFYARIRDESGTELAEFTYIQGGAGWLLPFGATIAVPASTTVTGTVEVWGDNPADDAPAEPDKVVVPIVFGSTLSPEGYLGYSLRRVEAGDTLSEIARQEYEGDASKAERIFAANRDQLDSTDDVPAGAVLRIPH